MHPSGPPSRQGGSPGQGSAHVYLPSFRALSQECQSHPGAFSHLVLSIWLYGDLSCSFGCRRDLLPVSSWFSMRIIPHVDVFFDVFVRGDELCLLLLCHLDLPSRFGPFYSYWYQSSDVSHPGRDETLGQADLCLWGNSWRDLWQTAVSQHLPWGQAKHSSLKRDHSVQKDLFYVITPMFHWRIIIKMSVLLYFAHGFWQLSYWHDLS